jgi:hypothetical protein
MGVSGHPAFPAPSEFDEGELLEKLGRIAPRECDLVSGRKSLSVVPDKRAQRAQIRDPYRVMFEKERRTALVPQTAVCG